MTPERMTATLRAIAEAHPEHRDRYEPRDRDALAHWATLELAGASASTVLAAWDNPLLDWLSRLTPAPRDAFVTIGWWRLATPSRLDRLGAELAWIGRHNHYELWVEPGTDRIHAAHPHDVGPRASSASSRELWAVLPLVARYRAEARPDLPDNLLRELHERAVEDAARLAPSLATWLELDLRPRMQWCR